MVKIIGPEGETLMGLVVLTIQKGVTIMVTQILTIEKKTRTKKAKNTRKEKKMMKVCMNA